MVLVIIATSTFYMKPGGLNERFLAYTEEKKP